MTSCYLNITYKEKQINIVWEMEVILCNYVGIILNWIIKTTTNCSLIIHIYIYIYIFLLLPLWSIRHPWNAFFHFSFLILRQSVGLLDGGSACRKAPTYTNTDQTQTYIHALNRIRTHDPSVRASEDSSCLRPRGHCDLPLMMYKHSIHVHTLSY
jgi:hypothetical protein